MGCQIKLTSISQRFDFKMDFMACLRETEEERQGDWQLEGGAAL